jgi:hypothetical protein
VAAALVAACSRDDKPEAPKTIDMPTRAGFTAHEPAAPPPSASASAPKEPRARSPFDEDAGSVTLFAAPPPPSPTPPARTPSTNTPAPAANPDDAILERTRVAAGGCFQVLRAGPGSPPVRTAHLTLSVIPTGEVSSVDVSSPDTTDPGVLACLRRQAQSAVFSDNKNGPLRTYAIDVRVFASENGSAH